MNSDIQMGTFVVPKIYHELTFSNLGDCDMFVNQRYFLRFDYLKMKIFVCTAGVGVGIKNRTVLN